MTIEGEIHFLRKLLAEKRQYGHGNSVDLIPRQLESILDSHDRLVEALNKCEAKAALGAKICEEKNPAIGLGFSIIVVTASAALSKLRDAI